MTPERLAKIRLFAATWRTMPGKYAEVESKAFDDLLAFVDQLQASLAWRPIASAPKDGRWILVFDADRMEGGEPIEGFGIMVVRWAQSNWKAYCGWLALNATAWLPLPVPPSGV